jgi:hypothetical protein
MNVVDLIRQRLWHCHLPQSGKPSCGYAENKVGVFAYAKDFSAAALLSVEMTRYPCPFNKGAVNVS